MEGLRPSEVCALAGCTERQLKRYRDRGLIDAPRGRGANARYPAAVVQQIKALNTGAPRRQALAARQFEAWCMHGTLPSGYESGKEYYIASVLPAFADLKVRDPRFAEIETLLGEPNPKTLEEDARRKNREIRIAGSIRFPASMSDSALTSEATIALVLDVLFAKVIDPAAHASAPDTGGILAQKIRASSASVTNNEILQFSQVLRRFFRLDHKLARIPATTFEEARELYAENHKRFKLGETAKDPGVRAFFKLVTSPQGMLLAIGFLVSALSFSKHKAQVVEQIRLAFRGIEMMARPANLDRIGSSTRDVGSGVKEGSLTMPRHMLPRTRSDR